MTTHSWSTGHFQEASIAGADGLDVSIKPLGSAVRLRRSHRKVRGSRRVYFFKVYYSLVVSGSRSLVGYSPYCILIFRPEIVPELDNGILKKPDRMAPRSGTSKQLCRTSSPFGVEICML